MEVAGELAGDNISIGVLQVPTSKPLDTGTILREAKRTGRMVIVAENHTV
ncbi:transketolase C-terminal domain-containing protein, partial [Paraburkholderia ginsengiterrae]